MARHEVIEHGFGELRTAWRTQRCAAEADWQAYAEAQDRAEESLLLYERTRNILHETLALGWLWVCSEWEYELTGNDETTEGFVQRLWPTDTDQQSDELLRRQSIGARLALGRDGYRALCDRLGKDEDSDWGHLAAVQTADGARETLTWDLENES